MESEQNNRMSSKYLWMILIAAIFIAGIILMFAKFQFSPPNQPPEITRPSEKKSEIKKFANEREFREYVEKARSISGSFGGRGGAAGMEMKAANDTAATPILPGQAGPSRFSETNVQVAGIDEPDVVKTDGKEIYFSTQLFEVMPLAPEMGRSTDANVFPPPSADGGTRAIQAFPPESLNVSAKIDKSGDLLLAGKTLIIIPTERYYWSRNASKIYGYDVSDPKNPKEIWSIELKSSTSIAGARLLDGKIYLALKIDFSDEGSCLIKPLVAAGKEFSLKCTDIYHPAANIPADSTFTVMTIDPGSGEIQKNVSFVGSSNYSSVVYMSENALYTAYYDPGDFVKTLHSFFSENNDLAPDWLVQKLKNLNDYDISTSAKMTEVWEIIGRYQNSLSDDERLKLQNEMANRSNDYLKKHRRDLDSTGIVKMNAENLDIEATGTVPGKLLNQFSLDEYDGNLRVATTIGENFLGGGFGFGINQGSNTVNDVYTLGRGLKTEGSVIDLGQGERIYAVRFIEDKGYVVTFKQMDPFYVIDLSDPMNPMKKGELKIPGYSSYLHPISKDKIIGVGEENNMVKLSLFDVSDPADPKEISKYNLDEYYSGVSETHHAFLLDPKHQIFFLPGSKGGYVFSFTGDNLQLAKALSDLQAKRAIYIDNFLYIIGEKGIKVLSESNWEIVEELDY